MRNFLVLMAAILAMSFLNINGQSTVKVDNGDYFVKIDHNVYMSDSADFTNVVFDLTGKSNVYYYAIVPKISGSVLSAVATTPEIETLLQYSYDGIIYNNIDTAIFRGSQADTSIIFDGSSATVAYPYLRLNFLVDDDSITGRVNEVYGSFVGN